MSERVAIITGGASGIGLAVATSLTAENWTVHVLDLNPPPPKAPKTLFFHAVNVLSYESLANTFDEIFRKHSRLDFVFANAGIIQMQSFYAPVAIGELPPPEVKQTSIDINLKAAINTCYLALHYFRADEGNHEKVLIATASIAALYAQEYNPLYAASKAGILNFIRSIGPQYLHSASIRSYALCPGTVRTNLFTDDEWRAFPDDAMTPVETLVSTVHTLLSGAPFVDAKGRTVGKDEDGKGLAVEIFGTEFFIRDQMEFVNEGVRKVCVAGEVDNQKANLV